MSVNVNMNYWDGEDFGSYHNNDDIVDSPDTKGRRSLGSIKWETNKSSYVKLGEILYGQGAKDS